MAYHHLTTPRLSKLVLNGQAKAYPFVELAKQTGEVNDVLGKHPVQVRCDHNHKSAEIFDADGKPLPGVVLFWFAWYAFHPQTGIYRAE
ncbi:MAG: hypothetical protein NMNS02_06610 [Nitrosomonas sp.]|nr:MAG: hypothetical protein NMNS02_06610 [Nitrosomonas sp.]